MHEGHAIVVDGDGHVCEPADLWTRRLPASLRERAIRLRWNADTGFDEGTHHPLILFFDDYMTLANLVYAGVLERHPGLRVAVLECGGGWIAHWMDRLDEFIESYAWQLGHLSLKPSEYFLRQGYVSFDPGERTMGALVSFIGAGNMIWASDFPHSDAKYPGVVDELRAHTEDMEPAARAKLFGENALRLYGIEATVLQSGKKA